MVASEHRQSRTTGTCIRAPQLRHPCACSAAAPCVWQGRALTEPSEISVQRNAGMEDARRHAAAARQRSARAPPSTRARSGGTRSPHARRCPATAARPCAAPRAPPACGRRSARSPPRRAPSLRARHRAASRCEGRFRVREPTQHMWYAAPGTEPARAAFARHRGARRTPCNPLPPATRWRSALLGQCRTRSTGTCPALANEATGRIRAYGLRYSSNRRPCTWRPFRARSALKLKCDQYDPPFSLAANFGLQRPRAHGCGTWRRRRRRA